MAGIAGMAPAPLPAPGAVIGDGETRAIGPTPNSGRPVEPDIFRPARGSRACTHSLGIRGARDEGRHARDRARVQRTALPVHLSRWAESPREPFDRSRATIPTMTTRRDHRQTHVRPRPPSSGRSTPVKVKPQAPGSTRLAGHRPIQRSPGLPMVVKIALIAVVLALGAGVLYVGMRGFGSVVGAIGSTVGGFVKGVTATSSPQPSLIVVSDAPSLENPSEPYTSQASVDLVVTVPANMVGDPNHQIRLYLTLPGQPATRISETPIADTVKTVIPGVELTNGTNDFTVTIFGPGGESDPSAVVRYVLDATPPKITITSPKANAIVNGTAVAIKGKTQARTTLLARNDANASSVAGTAGTDGTFSLSLALAPGVNVIHITATDPAGNVTNTTLSVRRGTGKLTVVLAASSYSIRRSRSQPLTLFATATDPDGNALAGVDVTFTLSVPGIPVVTVDRTTGTNGKASFQTTIDKGAAVGLGSAAVLISSTQFGSANDNTVIKIVK
jgi:Glucodextranase, domain B